MKDRRPFYAFLIFLLVFIIGMLLFSQIQDRALRFGIMLFGGIMLGSLVAASFIFVLAGKPKNSFTYTSVSERGIEESHDYDRRAYAGLLVREGHLTAQMADEVVSWIANTKLPRATIMKEIRFNADYCISCYGVADAIVTHSFILGVLQTNGVISEDEHQQLMEELKEKAIKANFK